MDKGNGCGMCGDPINCSRVGYCITDYKLNYDQVWLWTGGKADRDDVKPPPEDMPKYNYG